MNIVRGMMSNVINKIKEIKMTKSKDNKKTNRIVVAWNSYHKQFVVVSIVYSTYMVALGTHGIAPKVMLIPQALYAAYLFFNK